MRKSSSVGSRRTLLTLKIVATDGMNAARKRGKGAEEGAEREQVKWKRVQMRQ